MNKNKIVILSALITTVLCGCSNGNKKLDALHIKKATDYLYEAELDYDFDYSLATKYYQKYMPSLGGCSAISIGNTRGRNYDWEYSEGIEFVVRTSKTNNRHASIGISSVTDMTNKEAMDGTYHDEQYDMLPFLTLDGINDAGIYVNVNVVPFQSLGKWEMKNSDPSDDMQELCGPRLILDNCSYLTDVVKEFDKYDWFSLGNNEETHLMVTGPRSAEDHSVTTAVFEFVPGINGEKYRKLCVISNNEADKVLVNNDEERFYKTSAKNLIMTNFNLWKFDVSLSREEQLGDGIGSLINEPMGYERYESLYASGATKDKVTLNEMQDIMKRVYYSNAYSLFTPNFWYSEYGFKKSDLRLISESERNPYGNIDNVYSKYTEGFELIKTQLESWKNRNRQEGPSDKQNLWETIHTSIFDYTNSSFRIIPAEGNIYYEYKL